jgi:hypothetical protein
LTLSNSRRIATVSNVRCTLKRKAESNHKDVIEICLFNCNRGLLDHCQYSSIATPYQLDTTPVEKLVGELKQAFPLLDFACWSSRQLNDMLRHQLAKQVQFIYVERDAIDSVSDWLRDHGYHTYANPGKAAIRQSFSIEENTAIVRPLTTKAPYQDGTATIEKILVDVLADANTYDIINIPEFSAGANSAISSQRIDISTLISYASRRKTDINSITKELIIN